MSKTSTLTTVASIASIIGLGLAVWQLGKRPDCPRCKKSKLEKKDNCLCCHKCGYVILL